MAALMLLAFLVIGGLSGTHDVVVVNQTGLHVARIRIGEVTIESNAGGNINDKLLIAVTPGRHDMSVIFRGGGRVTWPGFDFSKVHEIIFQYRDHKFQVDVNPK